MLLFSRPLIMLLGETLIAKSPALWGIPAEAIATRATTGKKGGASHA
jgi:hypothetical protein